MKDTTDSKPLRPTDRLLVQMQIEEICSSFEQDWSDDSIREIETLARKIESNNQSSLIGELLSVDFELRQGSDAGLSLEVYLAQLPEFSKETNESIGLWQSKVEICDPAARRETRAPERIGDYRIVRFIGKGGAGAVYEAVQESLDRPVAIKVLSNPHVTSQLSRFQQEARAVALLHHTNIVEVFGSGIDDGLPYFAMQLVKGSGLDQIIDNSRRAVANRDDDFLKGKQGQRNIAKVGLEVARALDHAHQQGVLHRDIKPSNLLVDEKGTTWVSDFGLAKLQNEGSSQTLGGGVIGTMRYVPPEAFSGIWSERSDIYSLGLTLYELFALQPAFSASDHPQLIKQITSFKRNVKPIRQIDNSISKDLETIISKAMSFEVKSRFQSAEEMGDELERYLNGLPIKSRPIPRIEKLWRWAKRAPAAAALSMLISAVAFIGLPIAIWLLLTTSSALEVAEENRQDAEAARYSSGTMLASSYIDDGRASDAKRLVSELEAMLLSQSHEKATVTAPWELNYLKQKLDTSKLTLKGDQKFQIWSVRIRPDDKQIATVHNGDPVHSDLEGEVILWDPTTGEINKVLKDHGSRVYGCAYSHDGKLLATIGIRHNPDVDLYLKKYLRGSISVWDVESGNRINMVDLPGEYPGHFLYSFLTPNLPEIMFSADDNCLISLPGRVDVRDTQSLKLNWETKHHHFSAALCSEGRLATFGAHQLFKFDVKTGEETSSNKANTTNLKLFASDSSRGKYSLRSANGIGIWDVTKSPDDAEEIAVPDVYWTTLSPDASQVAYSTRKGDVRIRPACQSDNRPVLTLLGHDSTVTSGQFSRDGKWMVTGSVDGTAKVWDLSNPVSKLSSNLMHAHISSISFSSDGNEILYCARTSHNLAHPNNVGTFAIAESQLSKLKLSTTHRAFYPRNDFSFSRDASVFAAPAKESEKPVDILGYALGGVVGVWSTDDWKQMHSINTEFSEIVLTAWSDDNRILAVSGLNEGVETIKLYLVENDSTQLVGELSSGVVGFEAMAFHGNSQFAAGSANEILIWNLSQAEGKTDSNSFRFNKPKQIQITGTCKSLDFSPDGSRLASADFTNDMLKVYDVKSGELCYKRSGPRRLCCVRYSPCGNRLALSGYDSIVHLCDAEFGYQLLSLVGTDKSPGTISINSKVVFSPDGRRIATNNWRGEVAFWEIEKSDTQTNKGTRSSSPD